MAVLFTIIIILVVLAFIGCYLGHLVASASNNYYAFISIKELNQLIKDHPDFLSDKGDFDIYCCCDGCWGMLMAPWTWVYFLHIKKEYAKKNSKAPWKTKEMI